jgi:hypothetical protein
MTYSTKSGLMVGLIVLFVCSLVSANEPNAAEMKLKFEMGDNVRTFDRDSAFGRIRVKPEYLVELVFLSIPGGRYQQWYTSYRGPEPPPPRQPVRDNDNRFWKSSQPIINFSSKEVTDAILGTSAAESFSARQRQLFESGYALTSYVKSEQPDSTRRVALLAASEDDARAMTNAFIEFLQDESDKELEFWKSERERLQRAIPVNEEQIATGREKQKALVDEYSELKKKVYYNGVLVAFNRIKEMNEIFQATSIEQASMQAKIRAIKDFIVENQRLHSLRSSKEGSGRYEIDRTVILQKLEQKLVDEMIELRYIEAKVRAVSEVLNQARRFVELDEQTKENEKSIRGFERGSAGLEEGLRKVESVLADPEPYTKPPKVFGNKAVIYEVEIKD